MRRAHAPQFSLRVCRKETSSNTMTITVEKELSLEKDESILHHDQKFLYFQHAKYINGYYCLKQHKNN